MENDTWFVLKITNKTNPQHTNQVSIDQIFTTLSNSIQGFSNIEWKKDMTPEQVEIITNARLDVSKFLKENDIIDIDNTNLKPCFIIAQNREWKDENTVWTSRMNCIFLSSDHIQKEKHLYIVAVHEILHFLSTKVELEYKWYQNKANTFDHKSLRSGFTDWLKEKNPIVFNEFITDLLTWKIFFNKYNHLITSKGYLDYIYIWDKVLSRLTENNKELYNQLISDAIHSYFYSSNNFIRSLVSLIEDKWQIRQIRWLATRDDLVFFALEYEYITPEEADLIKAKTAESIKRFVRNTIGYPDFTKIIVWFSSEMKLFLWLP